MDKKYLLKVADKEGNIYTMPSETPKCILEVHYSTSYYQFIVQDVEVNEDGKTIYPEKNIIVPLENPNPIDMMAIGEDEIGEIL